MIATVWKSPVPSTAYLREVDVQIGLGREIALVFQFEGADGTLREGRISFKDVVLHRTTYLYAIRAEVIEQAYDRLVDMGSSPELRDLFDVLRANGRSTEVRHFQICFDDGPCFDLFARAFEVQS